MNGFGVHEVVIETPSTIWAWPTTLLSTCLEEIIRAYLSRLTEPKKDPRFQYRITLQDLRHARELCSGAQVSIGEMELLTPYVEMSF